MKNLVICFQLSNKCFNYKQNRIPKSLKQKNNNYEKKARNKAKN